MAFAANIPHGYQMQRLAAVAHVHAPILILGALVLDDVLGVAVGFNPMPPLNRQIETDHALGLIELLLGKHEPRHILDHHRSRRVLQRLDRIVALADIEHEATVAPLPTAIEVRALNLASPALVTTVVRRMRAAGHSAVTPA